MFFEYCGFLIDTFRNDRKVQKIRLGMTEGGDRNTLGEKEKEWESNFLSLKTRLVTKKYLGKGLATGDSFS